MKTTKLVMLVMTIAVALFILIPNLSWADDGVIEAVEIPGDSFVLAVQWHPEEMTDSAEPWDRGLFKAFAKQLEA